MTGKIRIVNFFEAASSEFSIKISTVKNECSLFVQIGLSNFLKFCFYSTGKFFSFRVIELIQREKIIYDSYVQNESRDL